MGVNGSRKPRRIGYSVQSREDRITDNHQRLSPASMRLPTGGFTAFSQQPLQDISMFPHLFTELQSAALTT